MKFPSIKYLATQTADAGVRFFLPLLIAMAGVLIGMWQLDDATDARSKLLFTATIGLSLSLGCKLVAERSSRPGAQALAVAISLAGMLAYWLWLAPTSFEDGYSVAITYMVLLVVMHLFVAIAPYIGHNQPLGFWRYNETLFIRLLAGAIFSGVLFGGLALAVTACEELFSLKIHHNVYPKLWLAVAGGFNTWYFLAGIPRNYAELNTEKPFPKMLRIFTQYILIPLVTLYMVILYAYGIRILVQWSLPRGWVSTLIMCYAVAGILVVLLVTPLRDDAESPWVRFFSRFFFIATLPLIVLLYVAIITRVGSYGITEPRYYLLLMGTWLGFISLYFIFSRRKNIKVVPASLAILGLVSLWGPWGVFSVSERSQVSRLQTILQKNKVWQPGTKLKAPAKLPKNDMEQVANIIEYLVEREKAIALQPLLAVPITHTIDSIRYHHDSMPGTHTGWTEKRDLKNALIPMFCTNYDEHNFSYNVDHRYEISEDYALDIKGYSAACDFIYNGYEGDSMRMIVGADTMQLKVVEKKEDVSIIISRQGATVDAIPLNALIKKLSVMETDEWSITLPAQQMTLDGTGPLRPRTIIKSLHLEDPDRKPERRIRELRGMVLFR